MVNYELIVYICNRLEPQPGGLQLNILSDVWPISSQLLFVLVPTIFNHMVNYSDKKLDIAFAALSDPTRRAIVARLARGEACASELADPFEMSLPAVSRHLRVLENASLIEREIIGRVHHFRLNPTPLKTTYSWLEEYRKFWHNSLDSLEEYLKKKDSENTQ